MCARYSGPSPRPARPGATRTFRATMAGMSSPRPILARPARRPSRRAPLLWSLHAALLWTVPLIVLGGWAVVDGEHRATQLWCLVAVLAGGSFGIAVVPWWRYAVHRWEITDDAVYTRVGWLT